jgi:hypothetical protein
LNQQTNEGTPQNNEVTPQTNEGTPQTNEGAPLNKKRNLKIERLLQILVSLPTLALIQERLVFAKIPDSNKGIDPKHVSAHLQGKTQLSLHDTENMAMDSNKTCLRCSAFQYTPHGLKKAIDLHTNKQSVKNRK